MEVPHIKVRKQSNGTGHMNPAKAQISAARSTAEVTPVPMPPNTIYKMLDTCPTFFTFVDGRVERCGVTAVF